MWLLWESSAQASDGTGARMQAARAGGQIGGLGGHFLGSGLGASLLGDSVYLGPAKAACPVGWGRCGLLPLV